MLVLEQIHYYKKVYANFSLHLVYNKIFDSGFKKHSNTRTNWRSIAAQKRFDFQRKTQKKSVKMLSGVVQAPVPVSMLSGGDEYENRGYGNFR